MAFADALKAAKPVIKGPPCSVGVLLAELDAKQAIEVKEALASPLIGHTVIARAIQTEFGQRVAPQAIGRHRRGACLCEVRRGIQ